MSNFTKKKIMFVIRGKLGDSLLAFMALLEYAAAFPGDEIVLLTRKAYLPLFVHDMPGRIISFNSRIEMMLKIFWLRILRQRFDVLAILWGFGPPIEWIGRWVRASRKFYLNQKLSAIYPEWPPDQEVKTLVDPAWKVLRMISPSVKKPDRVHLRALAERHLKDACAIGVVPVADEPRKCLDAKSLLMLLDTIRARKPGFPIWILLNKRDDGAGPLLDLAYPAGSEIKLFSNIENLLDLQGRLSEWIGVDTGLYHLAASMGIPATLFFGPTQPAKIILPGQQAVACRIAGLRGDHCEVKSCTSPKCLYRAVELFAGHQIEPFDNEQLPDGCLLPDIDTPGTTRLGSY